ncbi:uncharacterized membrane protein YhaH (DUF805 family) [Friedmanniella endophytica]|uniref:Uncharacterized membrane protein YhaH (DUF805 family) n=1 Tax=Microlunatus kandeliicorticis TaxID=1759536 RepID=A0A7W3ISY1_9ACTN|nr:DUF805 domain-containing protein [Microlunatus kandeliicorticis]MBA8794642.1 uncharacterized membrane protein YhaH (DUF805 family) [Microlunatus kandeliicorticis]
MSHGPLAPGGAVPVGPEPPLNQPAYVIGLGAAVRRALRKYAVFHGRASRREFWWWCLAQVICFAVIEALTLSIGAATADAAGTSQSPLLALPLTLLGLWVLGTIVPSIAVSVRRLHDAGHTGKLYLLNLLNAFGFVGAVVVLVFCALPSSPSGVRYDRLEPGQAPILPAGPAGWTPASPYPAQAWPQQPYPQQPFAQQPYAQPFPQPQDYPQQPYPGPSASDPDEVWRRPPPGS